MRALYSVSGLLICRLWCYTVFSVLVFGAPVMCDRNSKIIACSYSMTLSSRWRTCFVLFTVFFDISGFMMKPRVSNVTVVWRVNQGTQAIADRKRRVSSPLDVQLFGPSLHHWQRWIDGLDVSEMPMCLSCLKCCDWTRCTILDDLDRPRRRSAAGAQLITREQFSTPLVTAATAVELHCSKSPGAKLIVLPGECAFCQFLMIMTECEEMRTLSFATVLWISLSKTPAN